MNIVFYLLEATSTVEAPFKIMVSYSTTADRLAQLVERRTTVRELSGWSPRPDQHFGS